MVREDLLQIIKDYIHNQKSEVHAVDSEKLSLNAKQHQLEPILYYQTKLPQFQTAYYSAVAINANRKRITDNVLNLLDAKGINAFLIKGQVIASYYPTPALRTMGDTDIVIDNLTVAHEVMLKYGFTCLSNREGREWQYKKNGMEFELHDRLVYNEAINEEKITDFLNDYQRYVSKDGLNPSFHFIFLLAHLRKHLMNSGVGLRQFLDVALMAKNCDLLDWVWIENSLKEIELFLFTKTVFAFIERWWGVVSPIGGGELSDEFYQTGTDYILKNGVFGFNNADNDNYLIANEVRKNGISVVFRRTLSYLFPSYRVLSLSEKYSFIQGRPILLPMVWAFRWFSIVIEGRTKNSMMKLSKTFVTNDYVEQREEMFKQWGLA